MCTDVDRNDKARICEPGSVRVIGRRQIEMHSRLIHTVDHVEGRLREGYDALDAFLAHAWAVTVTGAPKASAMLDAVRRPHGVASDANALRPRPGEGRRVLLVDHRDSFVHTLADYFRQTGAEVVTLRAGFPEADIDALAPAHGHGSRIRVLGGRIFEGLPPSLRVTAETEDGTVMAVEHAQAPLAAVQFHPESILTLEDEVGLALVRNVVTSLAVALRSS